MALTAHGQVVVQHHEIGIERAQLAGRFQHQLLTAHIVGGRKPPAAAPSWWEAGRKGWRWSRWCREAAVVAAGVSPATSVRSHPLLASGAAVALSTSPNPRIAPADRQNRLAVRRSVLGGAIPRQRKKQSGQRASRPHDRKNDTPREVKSKLASPRVFGTLDFAGLPVMRAAMGCRASPCPNFGPGTGQGYFWTHVNEGYARGGCPGRVSITASGAGAVDRMMGQDAKDSRSYGVVPIMRPSAAIVNHVSLSFVLFAVNVLASIASSDT